MHSGNTEGFRRIPEEALGAQRSSGEFFSAPGVREQEIWDIPVFPPALALAMVRDGSSGGVIRLAAITEDGVERTVLAGSDLPWGDGGPPV